MEKKTKFTTTVRQNSKYINSGRIVSKNLTDFINKEVEVIVKEMK